MQIGKWIPLDKRLIKFLPKTRKYTEMEAAFSLSIDYDNQNNVTESGYSKLWGWSRTKVNAFLEDMGVELVYPDGVQKSKKQKRHIKKHKEDIKKTEERHIRLIDSKWLAEPKNIKRTLKEQKKNRSKDTTIDPSLKPNPDLILLVEKAFEKWWLISPKRNGRRIGKKKAQTKFEKIDQSKWKDLKTATINYCDSLENSGLSAMDGHRFLSGEWVDYIEHAEHSEKKTQGKGNLKIF